MRPCDTAASTGQRGERATRATTSISERNAGRAWGKSDYGSRQKRLAFADDCEMVAKHVDVDCNERRGKEKSARKHGTEVSWRTRHIRFKDWHTSALGYLITPSLAFEHRTFCMKATYPASTATTLKCGCHPPARAMGTTDK